MDFVADQLFDGRPIRILAVLDAHTREALSIVPRASFRAFDVVAELTRLVLERGRPKTLKVDNGPEFAGRLLAQWAYLNGLEIDFSRPGKPTDTDEIEQPLSSEMCYFLSLRATAWQRAEREVQAPPRRRISVAPRLRRPHLVSACAVANAA